MRSTTRVRRRVVVVASTMAIVAAAHAAAQSTEPLTLGAAVSYARAHHPALAAASARRRAAAALARQESSMANPTMEWRRENLGSPLMPDVFATVAQSLDVTGRRLVLRARARDVDRSAAADSITTVRDVEAATGRAFWRASLATALLGLAEQQRIDAGRLAQLEEIRAREGGVAEVVAIRTRAEYERTRIAEATARASSIAAGTELARAMGVSPDALPPIAPLSVALRALDTLAIADATVAYALSHRSELTAVDASVDAANRRVAAERRAVLSDVTVEVGTKQTAGYSTRVLAVAVPVPLFNRNAAARDRAVAELDLVRADRRAMEQAVRANVMTALDSYRALRAAQPEGVDSLVARAAEVARIADAAYAAGGGSLLELLDARRARVETESAVLRWVADLRIAHLELLRALGAPPLESLELP